MKINALFVVIILAALVFSFFGQHGRVYSYLLDNEQFTQKYCVNKNQPESTCKGACQMKKMASEQDRNQPAPKPEIKSVDLFIVQKCHRLSGVIDFPDFEHFFYYRLNPLSVVKHEVLPPPDVLWT